METGVVWKRQPIIMMCQKEKIFLIPISWYLEWEEWEVTEILKRDGIDAEQYIGADFPHGFKRYWREKVL